jgi:hypothetical protein
MARMVVGTLVTLLLVLAPYTITTAQEPMVSSTTSDVVDHAAAAVAQSLS